MLVLSRRIGERIFIGQDIEVILLEIQGGFRARLGIVAPPDINIAREELVEECTVCQVRVLPGEGGKRVNKTYCTAHLPV